ncbi:MAG TPA: hypothetical protein VKX46_10595 [Ktedonobacteraceae bacterium]|nr:hypothetical protein [Ktedonobacteraceae bacterium]
MVAVPGTNFDTSHATDETAIDLFVTSPGRLALVDLQQLKQGLSAPTAHTQFEQNLLPKIDLAIVRQQDIDSVYHQAQQGNIWSKARIIVYNENNVQSMLHETPLAQASAGHTGLRYANRVAGNVDAQVIHDSLGDAEVGVLSELYDFITGTGVLQKIPRRLYIILSGSMGPCLGCQGRIAAFIDDLNALANSIHARIPLTFEVNYTTATNPLNRTQYGYDGDKEVVVGPQAMPDYVYWSKTFEKILG